MRSSARASSAVIDDMRSSFHIFWSVRSAGLRPFDVICPAAISQDKAGPRQDAGWKHIATERSAALLLSESGCPAVWRRSGNAIQTFVDHARAIKCSGSIASLLFDASSIEQAGSRHSGIRPSPLDAIRHRDCQSSRQRGPVPPGRSMAPRFDVQGAGKSKTGLPRLKPPAERRPHHHRNFGWLR